MRTTHVRSVCSPCKLHALGVIHTRCRKHSKQAWHARDSCALSRRCTATSTRDTAVRKAYGAMDRPFLSDPSFPVTPRSKAGAVVCLQRVDCPVRKIRLNPLPRESWLPLTLELGGSSKVHSPQRSSASLRRHLILTSPTCLEHQWTN
jgi:hypothetical protein